MRNFNLKHVIMIGVAFILLGITAYIKRADDSIVAETTISKGQDAYKEGRYIRAISFYEDAIELDDKNYKAYFSRGMCYERIGEPAKALKDYSKSIELSPKSDRATLYFLRGNLLVMADQADEGCKDLHEAEKLGNKDAAGVIEQYCNQ